MGQVFILLINQAIYMKDLNYHFLCPMQCHVNGVVIDEVPKFLTPIPSKTIHAMQVNNPFNTIHPIIISLQLTRVTSYLMTRKSTPEQYDDPGILKIELTVDMGCI